MNLSCPTAFSLSLSPSVLFIYSCCNLADDESNQDRDDPLQLRVTTSVSLRTSVLVNNAFLALSMVRRRGKMRDKSKEGRGKEGREGRQCCAKEILVLYFLSCSLFFSSKIATVLLALLNTAETDSISARIISTVPECIGNPSPTIAADWRGPLLYQG